MLPVRVDSLGKTFPLFAQNVAIRCFYIDVLQLAYFDVIFKHKQCTKKSKYC